MARKTALSLALLACATIQANAGVLPQADEDKQNVIKTREFFSTIFLGSDARARLQAQIANKKDTAKLAELLGLLEAVPFFYGGRRDFLDSLRLIRPRQNAGIREQILLSDRDGRKPPNFRRLAKLYPWDFVAQERFAFSEILDNGGRSSDVENAIRSLEEITNVHPVALIIRARKEFYVRRGSAEEVKSLQLSYVKHKLFNYARKAVGVSEVYLDTIAHITTELKKKGITPPEPTPEQYAAVKKRGWAFNKQMLEPFKKVD